MAAATPLLVQISARRYIVCMVQSQAWADDKSGSRVWPMEELKDKELPKEGWLRQNAHMRAEPLTRAVSHPQALSIMFLIQEKRGYDIPDKFLLDPDRPATDVDDDNYYTSSHAIMRKYGVAEPKETV